MNHLSIYIHWPFCLSKCPYCDFNSHVASSVDHNQWLSAYHKELDYFVDNIKGRPIRSIFFGGGTPSLMSPDVVGGVIEKIAQLGIVDSDTEITLEANPTSFEAAKFKAFKAAGINRVSIGVQALRAHDLKALGREHDTKQAISAIETAASLFSKISFDLIYARSGQTLEAWQEELAEAMTIAAGHISLYQLTIEKGTPFYKLFHDGKLQLPENDLAADMYEWTNEYLESRGYNRYEISNYALSGHECKHNLAYWYYDEYLGIGPGAHSRLHSSGVANIYAVMMKHNPNSWLSSALEKGNGIQSYNLLTAEETISEFLMMGLRLKDGIDLAKLQLYETATEAIDWQAVEYYTSLGMLQQSNRRLALTDKGLMLHSYIVPRLLKC